jgi:hypothetical protein
VVAVFIVRAYRAGQIESVTGLRSLCGPSPTTFPDRTGPALLSLAGLPSQDFRTGTSKDLAKEKNR